MALPETIRVKLSSEEAGSVSVTAVVVRDMPVRELVELMLGVTGKAPRRVHELLLRGALVSGASRFRWTGWDADVAALESLLASFPESEPDRPFAGERAIRAVLRGPVCRIDITREAGVPRRFLHRGSFWAALMELAAAGAPRYVEYSYKPRADCYRMELTPAAAAALREHAGDLKYSALESQVRNAALDSIDFYVARKG
jgi:hypothetical protein